MDYNTLKALYEAETNPAVREIYGNHLRRMEGKQTGCGVCIIEEPEIIGDVEDSEIIGVVEEPSEDEVE